MPSSRWGEGGTDRQGDGIMPACTLSTVHFSPFFSYFPKKKYIIKIMKKVMKRIMEIQIVGLGRGLEWGKVSPCPCPSPPLHQSQHDEDHAQNRIIKLYC